MATNNLNLENSTINESNVIYHERIGSGSDGDVYRITWKSKDGDVEAAAKTVKVSDDPESREKLSSEIQMIKNLNHKNVIKYYGHVVTQTHVIIVMEYAAKGSLFSYLGARRKGSTGRLSSAQTHTWASQAAKGIQYLRKKNVVHRDIKSPNFLIMADDTLKLCDFGLAKYLPTTKTTTKIKGTYRWLAPEAFRDSKLSPKADVFAFGIVLWELITGKEPYKGMRQEHIMYSVCEYELRPEIPQQCPDVYRTLMKQCWEAEKDKRPSIDKVVAELDGTEEKYTFPPGQPGQLEVSNIGTTHVTLSWDPPEDVGESPVIGYLLKYNDVKSDTEWTKATQVLIAKSSCTVTGLKAGSKYQFTVTAKNEGGHGHESEPLETTTVESRRFYIVITALVAVFAYVIYVIKNKEDFRGTSSWILEDQFGHLKLNKFGDFDGAQSIAVNPLNGYIAVADWYSAQVKVFDSEGNITFGLDTTKGSPLQIGKKAHPRDIAVSSNGTYFVTNETPFVKVFDSSGVFTHEIESSYIAEEGARLSGITFDSVGNLIVGECRFKSISIHSHDGAHLITLNTDLTPRYLAITPSDNIVVSSWNPHAVQVLSQTGKVLHTLYPPKEVTTWRPTGVSCSQDTIFVANDEQSVPGEYGIYCYSLSGEYLGCATKAVTNPTGIAVTTNGEKLIVAQWERGNQMEGSGVHGVKIFRRENSTISY